MTILNDKTKTTKGKTCLMNDKFTSSICSTADINSKTYHCPFTGSCLLNKHCFAFEATEPLAGPINILIKCPAAAMLTGDKASKINVTIGTAA